MNTQTFQLKRTNWQLKNQLPQGWETIKTRESGGAWKSPQKTLIVVSCWLNPDNKKYVHVSIFNQTHYPWDELKEITELFLNDWNLEIQKVFKPEWEDHPYCFHIFQCLDKAPVLNFRKLGTT